MKKSDYLNKISKYLVGTKDPKTPTQNDWASAKRKLNALRELCINDDLLDLQAYDSIERSNKIQDAWDALDVIEDIDKLLADARKEVIGKVEKRLIDIRQRCSYLSINSTEIVDPYVANLNAGLDGLASDLATLREEKTK